VFSHEQFDDEFLRVSFIWWNMSRVFGSVSSSILKLVLIFLLTILNIYLNVFVNRNNIYYVKKKLFMVKCNVNG
jgi:hypothetical protein